MHLRRLLFALLTAMALLAAACGGEETGEAGGDDPPGTTAEPNGGGDAPSVSAEPTGEITVAYSIGVITFNPHISQPGPQYGHLEAVYDTFIRTEDDGTLVPGLATDWEFLDDAGLEFQMTLRTGVPFHDGEVFDAEVAKANLDASRSQDGARSVLLRPIESVEVIDDETVLIQLSEPSPTLPQALASMVGMVVSPNLLGTDAIEGEAIGTGPYVYDRASSVPGDRYVFDAFAEYWDEEAAGRPARITLLEITEGDARVNALRSGQLDGAMIGANQADTVEAAGIEIVTRPDRYWGLLLQDRDGERVPELGILEVRQAMNHAVDRDAIIEAIAFGRGTPTNQLWSSADSHFSQEVADLYPYDPDLARQMLADAGVTGFSFAVPFLPVASSYAQAVQEYLREVGIEMEIEIIEPGTLGAEARSGDWAVSSLIAGGIESAAVDTGLYLTPDAIYNTFNTSSPELSELISAAQSELDQQERSLRYQEVSRYVTERAWFLITHYVDAVVAHDSRISNWRFRADGSGVPVYRDLRVTG